MSLTADRRPLTIGIASDHDSVHVQRWSAALAERGHAVVRIDMSGRGRSPAGRITAYARLRGAMQRVAASERGIVAVHFVPRGILATGLRGVHPIVLSAWGHDVTGEQTGIVGWSRSRQQRGLFRAADRVTVTSTFLADVVRRRFGVDATVVPFGIDVDRFRPRSGPRRTGPIRIGFLKLGLEPKYGPDVLIEALGRLAPDKPFEAVVAGEGTMGEELRDRTRVLGIADQVQFIGRRPHAEVASLLSDLDVFVMPSRREEWGVAAAEASAAGLPIVATAVGGIPEIVVDGHTGLLIPPEDAAALAEALARLIGDLELRDRFGEAGRRKVEAEYRWEFCVNRMEGVLYDARSERDRRRQS